MKSIPKYLIYKYHEPVQHIYCTDMGLQRDLNDHLEVAVCFCLEPDIFSMNVICIFRNCGKGT